MVSFQGLRMTDTNNVSDPTKDHQPPMKNLTQRRVENRQEDMSRSGYLELMQCEDGDIHVTVRSGDNIEHFEIADVEFTLSGGHSPHTLEALRHLMDAMKRDNDGVPWPLDSDKARQDLHESIRNPMDPVQ